MRIVGGKFRGRTLVSPSDRKIRPTTDRARETIFNILQHGCHMEFEGKRVIDVFAGTGSLGLEALSRGVAFGLFVEQSAEARALIRRNVEALGLTGQTKIYRRDATRLGMPGTLGRFDIAFLDPPYETDAGMAAVNCLLNGGWLKNGAILILEERKGVELQWPEEMCLIDRRELADTQLNFAMAELAG